MSRPDRYGLVHLQPSCNPLRVALAQWTRLAHDPMRARSLRARSLRAVLGDLFMRPGWVPVGRSSTTTTPEAVRAQQRALGATASPAVAASGTSSGALGQAE